MTATETTYRCSFCGKTEPEVAKMIAGPGVCICDECVTLCDEILADLPRRDFPSLDDRTDDELLVDVARVAATGEQLDAAVHDRVRRLRTRRVSWARIGETLGVSRQSAWERFSGPDD